MNKNLLWKLLFIVGTMLFFLFGIFGIPKSFSGDGLLTALTDHIHLGLDLKGGTHLILQVQVNDAVNVDAQNAIEILKDQFRSHKIDYTEISQPDPQNNPDHLVIKGVPPEARSDLRSIVQERLPEYDVTTGASDTWNMAMKPSNLSELKSRAVTQAIETIRNRVDALGVSEPTIQEHGLGQYQILVQLPGVDDMTRVQEIMQNTAMLEIKQVHQRALSKSGGGTAGQQRNYPGRPVAAAGEYARWTCRRRAVVSGLARLCHQRQRPAACRSEHRSERPA